MEIIIFGASGTGKTTLGKSLSKELNWTYLDSDDYYWLKTNPPFQLKIPLEVRNKKLKTDFENNGNTIVSGSLCTWSRFWDTAFDLGVFLRLPKEIRMARLRNREMDRYGKELDTNENTREKSEAFLEWAATYDNPMTDGASIKQHREWIKAMSCEVLELNGDLSNHERLTRLINKIEAS